MYFPPMLLTAVAPLLVLTSAADITFTIPPSTLLTNPSTLPPSTHATLFRLNNTLSTPLSRYNTFDFKDVSAGSYLLTIQCLDYSFGPSRVDVTPVRSGEGSYEAEESVEVYQTFLGNEWANKGERRGGNAWKSGTPAVVELRPERVQQYYTERAGFSPMSYLKNPMVLMALVSLVLIVGLPYLTENMDDETKAEFEELQKSSTMNPLATSDAAKTFQDFDLASFLSGSGKKSGGDAVSPSSSSGVDVRGGGDGKGSGKRR